MSQWQRANPELTYDDHVATLADAYDLFAELVRVEGEDDRWRGVEDERQARE